MQILHICPIHLLCLFHRYNIKGNSIPNRQLAQSRQIGGNNGADRESTRYLENGDYFKLKSLSLAYSFPKRWLEPLGVKSANLSVGGENLFTITSFSGQDPEILYSADYNGSAGSFGYPTVRRFTLGLNVQF